MNTLPVKPSKIIKGITSMVSTHLNAVERAREIYLGQMKRAEAEYFDRIKRATETVSDDAPAPAETVQPTNGGDATNATA